MSIATAIQNAQGKVANAYTAVSNKGGTLPATQNLSNLPTAINSIQVSSGSVTIPQSDRLGATTVYNPNLFSGTSHGSSTSKALNYTKAVTVTSGTYTLWHYASNTWYLIATITL